MEKNVKVDNPNTEEKNPQAEQMQKQLEDMQQQYQQLAQVMADEDIQKVMMAKQNGQPVRFAENDDDDEASEADLLKILEGRESKIQPDEEDKLNNLSNRQLVKLLSESVQDVVSMTEKNASKQVDTQLQSVDSQIKQLRQSMAGVVASLDIKQAQSQYNDFDKYRGPMKEIWQKHPSLSANECYLLAKSQDASNGIPQQVVATEKPDNNATRSERAHGMPFEPQHRKQANGSENSETMMSGKAKFEDIIASKLNDMNFDLGA